jgi:hypothetical protein
MKVKGESFTETLKNSTKRKKEKNRRRQKSSKEKKRGKKTEGQKEKPREENKEMKAKSERHKKIASKGASLGKLRDVLSASWDELNYLS